MGVSGGDNRGRRGWYELAGSENRDLSGSELVRVGSPRSKGWQRTDRGQRGGPWFYIWLVWMHGGNSAKETVQ